MNSRLSRWSWAVSIPLAAALLYWSTRGVDWRQVWKTLADARPGWLLGFAVISSCTLFLRAVRWRILLNAEDRLGIGTVFRANMVGYLGNNFLPARAGEVLRSVIISRNSRLTSTYVLTTAVSERLTDVIAVVLAGSLALLGVKARPQWVTGLGGSLLAVAIAGVLAIALLPHAGRLIEKFIAALPLPERIRKFLLATADQVLLGVKAFHSGRRLSGFAILTAVIWAGDGMGLIVGAQSLNLGVAFPAAILLLVAMALGSALPSTPGYIGIYQFAAVMVLVPFGIPRDRALAFSVVVQAVGYFVVTAFGLPSLYAGGTRDLLRTRDVNAKGTGA